MYIQAEQEATSGADSKGGFFSKEKRDARKQKRIDKRIERKIARAERRAKRGARRLKPDGSKKTFKDYLPKLRKRSDGDYDKTTPEGENVIVPKNEAVALPPSSPSATPVVVAKEDVAGKKVSMEGGTPVVTYKPSEVTQIDTANGVEYYKNADIEEGMSTTIKVLIGVGALAVVGIIVYLVKKKK